jgi:hypothetical protein
VDVLDAAIERLERELAFLEKQADRLSAEIKSLRQSDMGQALTDFDRGKREGYGIDFKTELTTDMMDQLEEAKEIFADALRRKEMTPELAAQLEPLDPMDVLDMFFDDVLGEEGDYDFFGPPPKFREGQLVEFRPAKHSAWLEDGLKAGIKGVIVDYADYPGDAEHVYELLFGPEVMQAVSAEVVTDWVEEYMLLPYIRIEEPELRPARGRRPDIEGGLAVGRKRLYAEALKDLDPEKRRRIEKIVLADPGASDEENWMAYFIEHPVRKPVPVRILTNPFPHLQNPTGQLMGIGGYDEEDGVLAIVENGGSIMPAPLILLVPGEEGPESRFLEDYQDWAERRLLVDFGLY